MAVFKCKMCGATLDIVEGATVCECEYCMTKQTLPKLTDEKRANLYDRANHFRRNNEFDKAMGIYENILNEDSTDAEAYWSLVLCHYGIEYVEDPTTKRRLPTVNRAQYTSIFDDENYKSAIANADFAQKYIYESEAKAINEIQKEILAISQKESPFDVFICYKETDANGRRTQDSVLAQELYYGLKNEGFKVFFSRITLEDKLGSAYEPCIFAALNSAKVMVVLGTRQEHFNAVWVKNEWSRYLSLIKQGKKKTLIPAYRDMDPYDLPDEFSHLQAQDMSKLGFMQDLIRGVKKIVGSVSKSAETTKIRNNSFDALIKRIYLLLEDGDFKKADELCEQILNGDPENAETYICELLIEFKCHSKDELPLVRQNITNSKNYNKIMRFGNDEQIAYVKSADDKIQVTLQKIREEEERKRAEERRKAEELRRKQEEDARRESSAGLEFALNKDGKGYTLTKAGNCTEKHIVIDKHKGLPITSIDDWAFLKCSNLTSITISNSVTSIGKSAFSLCSNLTSITILNSVTSIGDSAFWNCSNLTSITIPNSVTSIGEQAFSRCSNLTSITIPNSVTSIGNSAFSSCSNLTSITIPNSVTSIGKGSFRGCSNLTSITIPNSVTSIGDYAFFDCSNLTSITIPNSVTSIGEYAFSSCTNLTSITIPNSVTSIGKSAFSGCSNLTSITIPNSVTSIGESAFSSCSNLTSITIPNSVTSIGDWAFDGCHVENATLSEFALGRIPKDFLSCVTILDGATSIGNNAFNKCSNLTSITIPNSVTSIGESAFSNCKNLTSITIANSVTSIGNSAFSSCSNLTSITIPNSVTSIGNWAFKGCTNLTSITIPNSVTSIGDWAFFDCTNLTSITIPNSVTSIGEGAFSDCTNLTSITIPNSVTSIGESAFLRCTNLTSITIPNSVTSIGEYAFSSCKNLTSITIPNSVTSIGKSAFSDCHNLTSITIPFIGPSKDASENATLKYIFNIIPSSLENVVLTDLTSIGNSAFKGCTNLTSITIPNSVTSIGKKAFCDCHNLTSITIPNSVTSIGESAFSSCKNLTSITIPNSVTSIGNSAFWGCSNLTSITIPNSVTRIGKRVFLRCENFKNIYCFENFNKIKGIHSAGIGHKTVKFYYSESKPTLKLFKRYWHYVDDVPTEW